MAVFFAMETFIGEKYNYIPMALFGLISLLCGYLFWLLPETRGHATMQTISEAEDFYIFQRNVNRKI